MEIGWEAFRLRKRKNIQGGIEKLKYEKPSKTRGFLLTMSKFLTKLARDFSYLAAENSVKFASEKGGRALAKVFDADEYR